MTVVLVLLTSSFEITDLTKFSHVILSHLKLQFVEFLGTRYKYSRYFWVLLKMS